MASWTIEINASAQKELQKLDKIVQKRITRYLYERIAPNPRIHGIAMSGDKSGMWRYRVGDYRIVVEQYDNILKVMVIRIGHRKDVYDF